LPCSARKRSMPPSVSSTYLRPFHRARAAITRVAAPITRREPVPKRSNGSVMP
jgi:hypothetical protein